MKTFIFAEKNGCATLVVSADDYEQALAYLGDILKSPENWRCDNTEGEPIV